MGKDQAELLKIISSFLAKNKIPYMITGAWSAIFYGRPRASHDIDFVVELRPKDIDRVLAAIDKLPGDFLIQKDSLKKAIAKKSMFNLLYLPTMLKLDFWILKDEEFDQTRFLRRSRVKILDQFMMMASAEDTILQKLRWYKKGKVEKHLIDAAFVYQIQRKNLGQKYLLSWVEKLAVRRYFKQLEKINLDDYL